MAWGFGCVGGAVHRLGLWVGFYAGWRINPTGGGRLITRASGREVKDAVRGAGAGWKWSLVCDRSGIPVGWAADGANRHDRTLSAPTPPAAAGRGPLEDVETLHLDRGHDSGAVRACAADWGIDDVICARRRPQTTTPLGLRWPVERTNSWLSNFGRLRRDTDRRPRHRLAQLALAIALLICIKLIDRRNRCSPPTR